LRLLFIRLYSGGFSDFIPSITNLSTYEKKRQFFGCVLKNEDAVKAILPVAGKGTRLRPLAHTYPKALIPVAGRPMIDWILDPLEEAGLEEAVFIVGWLGADIESYVRKTRSHLKLKFIQQGEMLGLGHAVLLGLEDCDEEVFIILGDTLFAADIPAICQRPHSVLGVREVADPRRFGVAEVKESRISKLVEKPAEPKSNLALIGLYNVKSERRLKHAIERLIDEDIRTKGEYQITDALQFMIDEGEHFEAWPVDDWFDCGKKDTLLQTNQHFLEQSDSREAPVLMGDSVILPPVFLGENVQVKASVIGPNVSVGAGSKITSSVLSDSLIGEETELEHVNLKQALVGRQALVQKGAQALNLSDQSEWIERG
jgi:glucose-1-phosphate thymidylyltransferase